MSGQYYRHPTEEDLQALVEAALDDECSFGDIIKLLRTEDSCLGLKDAAVYCKVVLGRLADRGNMKAHLMRENIRSPQPSTDKPEAASLQEGVGQRDVAGTAMVVPDNELWLHEPRAREDLQRALLWAQSNPPQDSDPDDILRDLSMQFATTKVK